MDTYSADGMNINFLRQKRLSKVDTSVAQLEKPSNHMATLSEIDQNSAVDEFKTFLSEMIHPLYVLGLHSKENQDAGNPEIDLICNNLLNSLSEFERVFEEFCQWKADFLEKAAPAKVKTDMIIHFAKLFRRYF
jgi:hypothetical protein